MKIAVIMRQVPDLVEPLDLVGQVDKQIRLLRRIPVDPMTGEAEWGLRSFQDDWDADISKFGVDIWMTVKAITGGFAVSQTRLGAKIHDPKDPGADLASYPLSQVPDEAAPIVRALLTADRNQEYLRSRMTDAQRAATLKVDYRPFIIADADTGHGGDPHVRNLIRRFVEVGVPGYHIEDQRPGSHPRFRASFWATLTWP